MSDSSSTDGTEPDGHQHAEDGQDEVARGSRQTGGDAPAAASVEDREAVAEGDDELFGDDGA